MKSTAIVFAALNLCALSVVAAGCNEEQPSATTPSEQVITVQINPAKRFQTIEHFGASDAWSVQFAGLWPDARRNRLADLLFSRETAANGQSKGIGLSLWRFNIGAGTAEQGSESGIKDEWRRAEGFLNPDGTYNWNKQAGQLWFLQAAKERGVPKFLAFPNSPPVQYTANGRGFATDKAPNLPAERFDDYANFLSKTIIGVKEKTGVTFDYVSPVNEPQWDWSDGGQEGNPIYNNQLAPLTRSLSNSLIKHHLPTKISIAEAGQIDYLYGEHNRPGRGSQVQDFFKKGSANYVGDLKNLVPAISGHSYFTTSPYKNAATQRKQLADAVAQVPGLGYWMSEYCILGDNDGEINGNKKDVGINPAIYVAKVIHNDLVNANATAWHWWIAISPYDYKDGLIYIDKNKTDGTVTPAKMLWALGNYSRFVRPSAVRVDAGNDVNDGVFVSSYLNTDNKLVTVIINTKSAVQAVKTTLSTGKVADMEVYETSETNDLKRTGVAKAGQPIQLPARSIVTLVGDYKTK